jgi:KDO2-lipid IV(A) lauroyltransferase
MSIDLQQILNSSFAVNLALFLGRMIPPRIGYAICDFIGDWIAQGDSKVTRAVRLNQWVVRGANLEKRGLDQAVQETLRNNVRDLYNLYHYIQDPNEMQHMISINPETRKWVERPEFADRGLVIVGLHLSNFDFVLQSISQQGFKAMVLTIPDPQGGRRVEYEMRRKIGMNLVPASVNALRHGVKHLEQGGMILAGLDHPVINPKYHPIFFGYPASLPTHYISLALKTRVPVVIMAVIQQMDGKYHMLSSEPIEMEPDPDHRRAILCNAERVLKQAENIIRLAPQQWNVPWPIWPELLDRVQS